MILGRNGKLMIKYESTEHEERRQAGGQGKAGQLSWKVTREGSGRHYTQADTPLNNAQET